MLTEVIVSGHQVETIGENQIKPMDHVKLRFRMPGSEEGSGGSQRCMTVSMRSGARDGLRSLASGKTSRDTR
jgi:hypothetical protein